MNWKQVGAILSLLPIFFGAVIGWILFPINVDGYWKAIDPSNGEAYEGCIHLVQNWPRTSVIGTIERNLDDSPNILGIVEEDRFDFEFIVFDENNEAEFGEGSLILNQKKILTGIWRHLDIATGRATEKGRWLLLPSDTDCSGVEVSWFKQAPHGFIGSIFYVLVK